MTWSIGVVFAPLRIDNHQVMGVNATRGCLHRQAFSLRPVIKPVWFFRKFRAA
jgi:hypothetical protein